MAPRWISELVAGFMTFLTPSAATVLIGVAPGVARAWEPRHGIGNLDLEARNSGDVSEVASGVDHLLPAARRETGIRPRVCCSSGSLLPVICFPEKSRNEEEAEDCKKIEQWLSLPPFAPFSLTRLFDVLVLITIILGSKVCNIRSAVKYEESRYRDSSS